MLFLWRHNEQKRLFLTVYLEIKDQKPAVRSRAYHRCNWHRHGFSLPNHIFMNHQWVFFFSPFFWRILLLKVMLVGSVIIMSLVIWCPFPFKENMIPCREIHGIIRPSHLCYSELLNACFVSLHLPSSARRCYFLLFSFNIGSLNDVFFSASSLWLQD